MHSTCSRVTTGGRGNQDMFTERDPKICAAGLRSAQPDFRISDCFKQYSLQDKVDSLMSDSIIPSHKQTILPPLRHLPQLDMRYSGPFSEGSQLINPPKKTKFETLVDDFKNTVYSSYWKKPVGTISDPVPRLKEGTDIYQTNFGKKTPYLGRLYDIVMPDHPVSDKTPERKNPGYQTNRDYKQPSFNPNITFGQKSKREATMKCCLTDDRIAMGTAFYGTISAQRADFQFNSSQLGRCSAPNDNISSVPPRFRFGKLKADDKAKVPQCLTNCQLNSQKLFILKCIGHLNTVRKCLSKRFERQFFSKFYLSLKYMDECKTGWLPKELIYEYCTTKYIRFSKTFFEPLLTLWNVFNGSQIEYQTFVRVLNYKEPLPDLPKICDVKDECIDFHTTYQDMVKPDQEPDTRLRAGIPSGRYIDMDYPVTPKYCCKADKFYLPHESDVKSSLCPSIMTLFGISHRDMFTSRTQEIVRKVFEAADEKMTDEKFDIAWQAAKKFHTQGMVSFETFRRALNETKLNEENISLI